MASSTFKPSETAKSARELVEHLVQGNGYVGDVLGITGGPIEGPNDRASLITRLKCSTEAILSKIESLPDEAMDTSVDFFGNPMPMPTFLMTGSWHIAKHAGHIDYLQTIWGDLEDRF